MTYAQADADLANRIQNDLRRDSRAAVLQGHSILIVLISPAANGDNAVQQAIADALQRRVAVVPVLASAAPMPASLRPVEPVDFSSGYAISALMARLESVVTNTPPSRYTPRERTPELMASNRRIGYVLLVIVAAAFLGGVYLIGVVGVSFPSDEYATVEAEVLATQQGFAAEFLPRSTEDAANFPATVQAAPTRLRPLLVTTATAQATSP